MKKTGNFLYHGNQRFPSHPILLNWRHSNQENLKVKKTGNFLPLTEIKNFCPYKTESFESKNRKFSKSQSPCVLPTPLGVGLFGLWDAPNLKSQIKYKRPYTKVYGFKFRHEKNI